MHASAIASRVLLLDLVSSISLSSWRLGALSFEILMLKPLPCGIHVRGGAFGGGLEAMKREICAKNECTHTGTPRVLLPSLLGEDWGYYQKRTLTTGSEYRQGHRTLALAPE